jgi:excisionase family DNA binding protein
VSYVLDLTAPLEQLKAQLRVELLAELRADRNEQAWPRWMAVETLARYMDASPERIRKLVARRRIPYVQEGPGCRVFFDRHEIDRWMGGFRQRPSSCAHERHAARSR